MLAALPVLPTKPMVVPAMTSTAGISRLSAVQREMLVRRVESDDVLRPFAMSPGGASDLGHRSGRKFEVR